jgi:hypothetical protein
MCHFLLTSLLMYALARDITGRPFGRNGGSSGVHLWRLPEQLPGSAGYDPESGRLPLALLGIHRATGAQDTTGDGWFWLVLPWG